MLFLSDTILRKRRKIEQRINRGSMTQEEGALRILELDPFDYGSLLVAGLGLTSRGDHEQARTYYWRALDADPTAADAYILLLISLREDDPELTCSLNFLALLRVLAQGGGVKAPFEQWLAGVREDLLHALADPSEDKLFQLVAILAHSRPDEPDAVTRRLVPYRLIQQVIDRPDEGMSREAADAVILGGSAVVPPLIGVLRSWARDEEKLDPLAAEAALGLLGEIGDQAAKPAIRECLNSDEPAVSPAAKWALDRIARKRTDRTVYDFCCSPVEAEEISEEEIRNEMKEQDRRISDMLLLFVKENMKSGETQQAFKMFFGEGRDPELALDEQIGFFDWLFNDYVSGRFRRTIAEEYLARNRERLGVRDRKSLQEWTRSYCSLFEIQRVDVGLGVELKDLLMGGVLFVHDFTASHETRQWDCAFTRVRKEGARTVFTAVGVVISPALCPRVREWIVTDKEASGLEWLPYLRANSHHIRRRCLEFSDEMRQNLRVVTAEGDAFLFGKAVYCILNRERLIEALEGSELIGAREDEDGVVSFAWFEAPETEDDEGRRVLGHLRIEDEVLILECQSRQRLKGGMALLQKLAGAVLEEKVTEFKSPQSIMKEKPAQPAAKSKIPPEVERQVITAFKEKHFRTWPDIALPALGGLTPRQVAQDPEGRERLIELLKQIENGEERDRREGRAWFDVSKLKADLGVTY